MLPFSIHLCDGEPVSNQIVRAAHAALADGRMRVGDMFPSTRTLAQELRISPTTAFKVVRELKDLGFLISRPGVGMVVCAPQTPPVARRLELLEPAARRLLDEARSLHLDHTQVEDLLRRLAGSPPHSSSKP